MKESIYAVIVCLLLTLNSIIVSAAVRLPSILGSHMVLQQNSEVKFWRWCSPAENIIIKSNWDTITYRTTAESSAKWFQKIKTPAVGGPYTITINETTVLSDVMIGEICSEPTTGRLTQHR